MIIPKEMKHNYFTKKYMNCNIYARGKCNCARQWISGGGKSILTVVIHYYNMAVWIWAENDINFSMASGLIRLHVPGVK